MHAATSTPQEGNVIVNLDFVLSVLASGNCTLFSTETARHRYEVQRLAGVDRFSYRITDDDGLVEDDDVVSLADIKRLARNWPADGWTEGSIPDDDAPSHGLF